MIKNTIIFFLFSAGIFLTSCSNPDNRPDLVEIQSTLRQWEPITLTFHLPGVPDEINQTLSSENFLYGIFRHIDEEIIVHGYFAGKHSLNSENSFNNTWKIRFTPSNYGIWTYQTIGAMNHPQR